MTERSKRSRQGHQGKKKSDAGQSQAKQEISSFKARQAEIIFKRKNDIYVYVGVIACIAVVAVFLAWAQLSLPQG